jgi:hypothetical protein
VVQVLYCKVIFVCKSFEEEKSLGKKWLSLIRPDLWILVEVSCVLLLYVVWILGLWGRCRRVLFELHVDVISVFLLRCMSLSMLGGKFVRVCYFVSIAAALRSNPEKADSRSLLTPIIS